ncbi:hypothetical protein C6366_17485 [Desulfonatronum sp. SC1]|nr:hypothetical protein C6366_17485 [Desulfonatronum sp. SC1]
MWSKLFGTAALAFLLCLAGLVMPGEVQAQQRLDNADETEFSCGTNEVTRDEDIWDGSVLIDTLASCSR